MNQDINDAGEALQAAFDDYSRRRIHSAPGYATPSVRRGVAAVRGGKSQSGGNGTDNWKWKVNKILQKMASKTGDHPKSLEFRVI